MAAQIHESTVTLPAVGCQRIAFIRCVARGEVPRPPLGYLHSVRSEVGHFHPDMLETMRQGYLAELSGYTRAFESWASNVDFDTIVVVPSSRCDARPFADALLKAHPSARDLSPQMSKSPGWRSGGGDALADARENIKAATFDASSIKSIAIVDDTLSTGNSAAVVLESLRENGLREDALVWLVVPLVLQKLPV